MPSLRENPRLPPWKCTVAAPLACISLLIMVLLLVPPANAADLFSNNARWSSFNLVTVNSTLKGFSGGVSDGRYVYFTPYYNGVDYSGNTVRYDTTKSFTDPASWEYFNVTRINPALKSFYGAAASGSYIYYIPSYNWAGYHGKSVRYDTTKPFTDVASWEYFDIQTVDASLEGFIAAVPSGNSVYYIPYYNDLGSSGSTARYDTTKPYTNAGSWEFFDTTTVDINLAGFYGGAAVGNYVYYCPSYNDNLGYSGVAARYDTTKPFTDVASWEHYDVAQVDPSLVGFGGMVSSGTYVYYIPWGYSDPVIYSGNTTRYDTTKSFTDAGSWEYIDIGQINETLVGFYGGAVLGNHVYYSPQTNKIAYSGTSARYDTTKSFTSTGSWEYYNMTPMNPLMKGFWNAVSSGDAVYFVPFGGTYNGVVGRYDATAAPVASFTGSPTSGAPPLAVTFTDTSTGSPTSWNWSFGDGTVSALQHPTHTYASDGSYSVNLTVTRIGESHSLVRAGYITVGYPAPFADFTAAPFTGTAPLAVQFTDASTGTITSRAWDFGDGTSSTLPNPPHTYGSAGTYTVNLTVTGPGGSDSEVKAGLVTVSAEPATQTGSSGSSGSPSSFAGSGSGLKAGEETTLRYQKDSTVRWIGVVPDRDLPDVMVTVTENVPVPKDLPAPAGAVLGTFACTLYHAQDGDLREATLSFRLPASRLAGTGLSPGDVVLMRAGETSWEILSTEYLGSSEGFLSYRATSPGFSTFAIVGVPGRAANLTVKNETTTEVTLTTLVPTTAATVRTTRQTQPATTPATPEATPARGIPLSLAPLLLSLAVPVFFRKK